MVENVIQNKNGISINVDVSTKIQENNICAKNIYIWNPITCTCENGKHLESIINDSVVIFDGIIDGYGQSQKKLCQ